nr:hypothetical protein [Streptococcus danieliae]
MIEEHYDELTRTEKDIADFFLGSFPPTVSLAANRLSDYLHVSEATLTRFAQKCGFSGYREFSYQLKEQLAQMQGEVHPGLSDKALRAPLKTRSIPSYKKRRDSCPPISSKSPCISYFSIPIIGRILIFGRTKPMYSNSVV